MVGVRSGHLNVTVALELTKYVRYETEYVPWQAALTGLLYIGDLLQGLPAYEHYRAYMRWLLKDIVETLGWEDEGNHMKR